MPDIFDGMEVDLVQRPRRPDLGIPHTGALGRADRPEELLNRTAPPQGPDDEGLHQARFPHWRSVGPPPSGQPNRNCAADKWTKIRDRSAGTVNGCEVTGGQWLSGYDGQAVTNPDIDHVVPLRKAWVSGADDWTDDQRALFANDVVVNLVAVSPFSDRSKGDRDPEPGCWPRSSAST
ncbi:DUF1524 domain-containing protein [Streptomyces sp. NPDC020898]|uniref:GmrSD restriction endonuclease domain-containing protein n=1 Tax=Streptomyces sp. NPDC020898 TaxID=3365101 RepID=UPI003799568D